MIIKKGNDCLHKVRIHPLFPVLFYAPGICTAIPSFEEQSIAGKVNLNS